MCFTNSGKLCGDCLPGYGTSFDLRFCLSNCDYVGIVLFVAICIITLLLSLAILYYDFPLPNELKGVIFFAQVVHLSLLSLPPDYLCPYKSQVIGVIYRNTPYLIQIESTGSTLLFLDFLINMLGFAMPFPVCFYEGVSAFHTAFLGFIPPIIATLTAILYSCWWVDHVISGVQCSLLLMFCIVTVQIRVGNWATVKNMAFMVSTFSFCLCTSIL